MSRTAVDVTGCRTNVDAGDFLENAIISTARANVPVILKADASIALPGPKDSAPEGGIIHYVMRLPYAVDIQPQDMLYILRWGKFLVNPSRGYRVFTTSMAGLYPIELFYCTIGDWIGR